MKGKYYTPEISDFFIGYECERFSYLESGHKKITISFDLLGSLSEREDAEDMSQFRTSFLTKEQIDNEGDWHEIYTEERDEIQFDHNKKMLGLSPRQDHRWKLTYNTDTHRLFIFIGYEDGDEVTYFDGECKSINEFRKIVQFLKIND